MDFLENIFKKMWKTSEEESYLTESTCRLKDAEPYLKVWMGLLGVHEQKISILPSLKSCGVFHNHFLLPEWLNYFATPNENRDLYLLLLLQMYALQKLQIVEKNHSDSRTFKRYQFLRYVSQVNCYLDGQLPGYSKFQSSIFSKIAAAEASLFLKDPLFESWQRAFLSRQDQSVDFWNQQRGLLKFKRNDQPPQFLALTCPEVSESFFSIGREDHKASIKTSTQGSELENEVYEKVQKTTLDDKKSQDNPVLHSFEKLETLDDYKGGYRTPCGEDQLQDHSKALKEVELSQMTTEGESSQSTYKSNQWIIFESGVRREQKLKNESAVIYKYGEWVAHKRSFLEDYCQVFQLRPQKSNAPESDDRKHFEMKYKKLIDRWQPKVDALLNQPLWQRKQFEGTEVDLDAHVRLKTDLQSGEFSGEARIFESKRKSVSDILPFFLIDQSMSTDSFVLGERVLDVFMDSTLLMGKLFRSQFQASQVASFCSASHSRTEFTRLKDAGESWEILFQRRKSIRPQGYTRLGPSLRHATHLLLKESSALKILILLTDGKPTDVDGYEGQHGIQDVREAIFEAEKNGIRVLSFVIDKAHRAYYQQMFSNYEVIQNSSDLCEKLVTKLMSFVK